MPSPLGIALSGIQSAQARIGASAHNIANLQTPGFRPLRAHQTSVASQASGLGGGSQVHVAQEPAPREVDLARELLDQMLAGHQLMANLRVAGSLNELRGTLVDLFA